MSSTPLYLAGATLVMFAVTYLIRLIPFLFFADHTKTPASVQYLGKAMPPAIIVMLILYSVRGIDLIQAPHGLPEILAIGTVVLLHLWKRQYLLSIVGGTTIYMSLLALLT